MELLIYGILLIVLGIFVVSFGRPFFRGAPYAPTDHRAINQMLEFAEPKSGEKSIDIGSGDGRLILALAERGTEAHGVEINRFLVWWSNAKLKRAGHNNAKAFRKNLWKTDFSEYDIVTLFGITYIMKGLEEKLLAELKPGSRVLSNRFRFPNWPIVKSENGVHLYIKE